MWASDHPPAPTLNSTHPIPPNSEHPPCFPKPKPPGGIYILEEAFTRTTVLVYTDEMIKDYAYPTMMAEIALKDLHNAVLDKKWDKAQRCAVEAIKWVVDIQDALGEMRKADES